LAKERTLGAVHVGRRSLLSGIITSSLSDIFQKLALSPTDTKFFLAPHIRAKNYGVGPDLKEVIDLAGYSPFIEEINSKTCFNLTKAVRNDLVKIGALEENIIDSEIDNFEDRRFFSYRRGDRNKLFVNIIYG
jgi:copper oxidase (laccase) domain-containing protein